jgi:hypothetical protein
VINRNVFPLTLTLSPAEREQLSAPLNSADVHSINPALDSSKNRETILPLLGERAGVRADVSTKINFS